MTQLKFVHSATRFRAEDAVDLERRAGPVEQDLNQSDAWRRLARLDIHHGAKVLRLPHLLLFLAALSACDRPGQPNLDATFSALIGARNDAMARGDTARVHRGITDDMEWVVGATGMPINTSQFLSAVSHIQNPRPEWTIDSVHVRDLGDVATVTYRRLDRRRVANYEGSNLTRALEVYIRRDGRWLLNAHSHTWIVQAPAAIAMDSTALAAFVGHYRIGDGYVDNVHFEAGHLVATATSQTVGAVLVPVSETAFSPDGVAPLMVYERDASGRVIGYVQGQPDGQVVRARRIQ